MADNVVPFRGHFPYFGHFNNLVTDTWKNFVSMLGTEKDKTVAATPVVELLDMLKLDNLYRGNWVCRKIVDLPAWDCCRAWRQWQAEEDQIEKLEEAERKHGLQRKVMAAISRARLYGGAAIILGLEGCGQFNEELDLDDVGKNALKFVHVISGGRHQMITAGQRILDVTSPWFGEPSYYMRSNTPTPQPPGNVAMIETSGLGYPPGSTLYIHPSRVVRLTGLDYPDPETSMDSWGDSVLQPVYDAARASGSVSGAIAAMVQESKIDIIKMKGLSELMSTREGAQRLYDRYSNSNVAKSVINTLMLDVEEEFVRHEMHYANLDKVMTLFLLVCAAAADIPATRLLGREPAGMNATGDSDIRNYYDRLAADQEVRLRPTLSKLDEVLIRSIFGDRDEDIHYTWNPLWQMSDEEQSQVELRKAQAFAIDVNAGLIDPMALKEGRQNSLIASGFLYKGLDAAIEEAETAGDDEDIDEQQSAGLFGEQPGQFGQPGAPPGGAPAGGKPPPFGGKIVWAMVRY